MKITKIPIAQIMPSRNERRLNRAILERMKPQIQAVGGPFQPIGVIQIAENQYRLVWGRHRFEVCRLLDLQVILAMLLPEGTTEADELKYSMMENHLRSPENFEDTLLRISAFATAAGVTDKQAAAEAGIDPSTLSRLRSIAERHSEKVKEFARKHKVGMSILYELLKVSDEQRKMQLLERYAAGELSRDALAEEVAASRKPRPKLLSMVHQSNRIASTFSMPEDATYEEWETMLNSLKARLSQLRKQGIPVHLLRELL
jgi:ParB-like chromosome segregation protein Spo0J